MDIHHLKVFLSVFKSMGFSKASNELYLTQPTISAHIKALEEELECKLFDRLGRTIIPTKEAKLLYLYAHEMVENLEGIKAIIKESKENVKGELLIGASTIPGTYIVPSIVSEFKRQYKDISFQVVIEDSKKITNMVSNNDLFLGIVGAKMENKKLEYLPFIEDELVLVSSPKITSKKIISTEEFRQIPFLIREEGSGTRKIMEKHLLDIGIECRAMNVVAILGSTDSVREAAKVGLGATILSKIAVTEQLKTGVLKEIKVKGLEMKRKFYIVTNKRRTLPKNYRIFLNYLKTKL